MKRTVFNLVSFKAGWLAVVLLAAAGMPVAGSVAALCVVALHLVQSPDRRSELLWMLFATTLNVGMRWLRRSTLLAIAAGMIGGPMAFLAGQSFGAVTFADPVYSPVIIGLGWAMLLPLMVSIAGRFDGFVAVHEPSRAWTTPERSHG